MTQGSNSLHFWYDASGRPATVEWNDGVTTAKYAYIHNLQGDIVGIVDCSGTEVVKYTYDAWGRVLSTTGSLASTLGTIQPFRYRGYAYDVETELYYLGNRYYDSCRARFINTDLVTSGNLFVYCYSNPVNMKDASGYQSESATDSFFYLLIGQGYETKHNEEYYSWDTVIYLGMDVKTTEAYIINDYFSQNSVSDYLNGFYDDKMKDILSALGEKSIGTAFKKIMPYANILEFVIQINKEIQKNKEKEMFANAYYLAKSKGTGVVIKRITHHTETYDWQQGFFQFRRIRRSSVYYEYYELEDFCTNQQIEELILLCIYIQNGT